MKTTARHLTVVAVKALGLLQLVQGFQLLLGSLFFGAGWLERFLMPETVGGLVWVAVQASVGLLLILKTTWVVDRLFLESEADPDDELGLGAPHVLVSAMMVVVGAALSLFALPGLLADVVRLVFLLGWDDQASSNVRGAIFWGDSIRHGFSFLVGLWFIRNWSGVLRRLTGGEEFGTPSDGETTT